RFRSSSSAPPRSSRSIPRAVSRRSRPDLSSARNPRLLLSLPSAAARPRMPGADIHNTTFGTPGGQRLREDIMTRVFATFAAIALAGTAAVQLASQATGQTGPGWTQVFDGKSLSGWDQVGEANWRIEDGAIVADQGKGGHLVSKGSYKNFLIYAEFWSDE